MELDTLEGGFADDDILTGDAGNDVLSGDDGEDNLSGGEGADSLDGGFGMDFLDGGAGADTMDGGAGRDDLFGGAGADSLSGGNADDLLYGGSLSRDLTDDEISAILNGGDYPSDVTLLAGDMTADTLDGGNGDDLLIIESGDVATGGAGSDLFAGSVNVIPSVFEAMTITDYDVAEDFIQITMAPGDEVSDYAIQADPATGNANVLFEGEVVLVVEGAAATLTNIAQLNLTL